MGGELYLHCGVHRAELLLAPAVQFSRSKRFCEVIEEIDVFTIEFLGPIYNLLEPCKNVIQDPEWHPEGSVYAHSFQVLHHALRESEDTDLILAAFCHDIGKAVNRLGHEKDSVRLLNGYLSGKSLWLIEHHMRIWYLLLGDMRKLSKVKYLLDHPWLSDLTALARWDKMGRRKNFLPYRTVDELAMVLNFKAKGHFHGRPT